MIGNWPIHRLGRCVVCGAMLLALLTGAGITAAKAMPDTSGRVQRVVSMNVCTDQLLLTLADRAQIASVSYLALDKHASAMAEAAIGLPVNHAQVEEILLMQPDLIIASEFTNRTSVLLLRKLGYPVLEVGVASSLEDIRTNIRTVARAVGWPDRGEAAVAAFDAKLPVLPKDHYLRPRAALYWPSSYSAGLGTLANAAVEAAGFRTLGRSMGFSGTVQLPLERLVAAAIDVLVVGRQYEQPALAGEIFSHPALKHRFSAKLTVTVPDRLWTCGTPFVADAIALLSRFRDHAVDALRGGTRGTGH